MLEDLPELSRSALPEQQTLAILIVAIGSDCYSDLVQTRALDIAYRAIKLAVDSTSRFNKEALTWRMNSYVWLDSAVSHIL